MNEILDRRVDVVLARGLKTRMERSVQAEHPRFPWPQVIGLGNVLRHAYEGGDDQTIWDTVEGGLPPLRAAVESLIDRLESANGR